MVIPGATYYLTIFDKRFIARLGGDISPSEEVVYYAGMPSRSADGRSGQFCFSNTLNNAHFFTRDHVGVVKDELSRILGVRSCINDLASDGYPEPEL